jgi:hypothetical protein
MSMAATARVRTEARVPELSAQAPPCGQVDRLVQHVHLLAEHFGPERGRRVGAEGGADRLLGDRVAEARVG